MRKIDKSVSSQDMASSLPDDDVDVYLPPSSARVAYQIASEVKGVAQALPEIVPATFEGDAPRQTRSMADRLARLSSVLVALLDGAPAADLDTGGPGCIPHSEGEPAGMPTTATAMHGQNAAPQCVAAPVLNITPLGVTNWSKQSRPPAVLIVNPAATLHERCALAYFMANEAYSIADSTTLASYDPNVTADLMPVLLERLRQLTELLDNIGRITGLEEGGTP